MKEDELFASDVCRELVVDVHVREPWVECWWVMIGRSQAEQPATDQHTS